MIRTSFLHSPLLTTLVLAATATAQQVVITTDDLTDTVQAFSPVDGSLFSTNLFAIPNTVQVSALQVGSQIWTSEQTTDRVVRYDACGNVLGTMGPALPGGGLDNIRGMAFFGGIVYVTNWGSGNGATANSLVTFDAAGTYLGTIALSASPSPFSLVPFQGDMLVVASDAGDHVHRYTLAGASVGTFNNSSDLGFTHASALASNGDVWVSTFTSDTIVRLDATTGAIVQTVPADNCRGIFELQNGNLLWTSANGATYVHDMATGVNKLVHPGRPYNLNLADLSLGQVACHRPIGLGCHDYSGDRSNLFEWFPNIPAAKVGLDGNALQFALTANGYVATWIPGAAGALFVPPSAGATIVANGDDTTTTITPSAPIPVPGGTEPTWTVSSNGILTAGTPGNQGTSGFATISSVAATTRLAFYTWCDHNPADAASGKIKWQEVAGVLSLTYDGVEYDGGTPAIAPSTFQYQIDMATGTVTMLWTSFSPSNSTGSVLVGCTLAGAGLTPVSQLLASVTPYQLQPDTLPEAPLALSAAPAPVINPSTLVTYTASNVREFVPGSGVYLGTMFLSVNPLPGGIDLAGILTTVPGCKAHIATLDLDVGAVVNTSPTLSWTFPFDSMFFAPGNVVAAQAVALFDGSFPMHNGEAGGFQLSNGVQSTTHP